MKKLLLMTFVLLGVAVQGVAQKVKVPAWEKFVYNLLMPMST